MTLNWNHWKYQLCKPMVEELWWDHGRQKASGGHRQCAAVYYLSREKTGGGAATHSHITQTQYCTELFGPYTEQIFNHFWSFFISSADHWNVGYYPFGHHTFSRSEVYLCVFGEQSACVPNAVGRGEYSNNRWSNERESWREAKVSVRSGA